MIERLRSQWPSIRAALFAAFVVSIAIKGIWLPPPKERYWANGGARYVDIYGRLTGTEGDEARKGMAEFYTSLGEFHAKLVLPLEPLYGPLRANQTWNMFSGARRRSFQMFVHAQRHGRDDWDLLYTVHDPDADFERTRVEYRRVRAAYEAFSKPPPDYRRFARWISGRVFEAHDDVDRVRVRMRRLDYMTAEERAENPERGVWGHSHIISRASHEERQRAYEAAQSEQAER